MFGNDTTFTLQACSDNTFFPVTLQACSDKLHQEMNDYGYPPQFPKEVEDSSLTEEVVNPADPTKKTKKVKSKVLAKSGSLKFQWQIMKSIGMVDEEIKK